MRAIWILVAALVSIPSWAQLMFKCEGADGRPVITDRVCKNAGRILYRERAWEGPPTLEQLVNDEFDRVKSGASSGKWSYQNDWNYQLPDGRIAKPEEYRAWAREEARNSDRAARRAADLRDIRAAAASAAAREAVNSSGIQSVSGAPRSAINVTTGQFMPGVAGGVIDPSNGTFHQDVGAGYVNSRTGEFSPKH